jgi:hypothetical protein
MSLSIFLFLSELGTCPPNLISTRGVEHWEKNHFPQGGMLKFTYKGHFLTTKKTYKKFLNWKSKWWKHALVPPLHLKNLFLKKSKILIFSGISKFCLWANFGSFGQNLLHRQWLRACPKQGWNLKNVLTHEPWVQMLHGMAHWKASIHIYHHKKFQKFRK